MKEIVDKLEEFSEYLNDNYREINIHREKFYLMYNGMLNEIFQIGEMDDRERGYAEYIKTAIVNPNFLGYKFVEPKTNPNKTRIKNTEIDPFDEEIWYEEDFIK